MNFIQCASRYVMRKKTRCTLLILLLTTIFTLILTVVSIAAHANTTIEQMENNFNREFVINAYNAPGALTLDRIAEISDRDDIAAYRSISNAVPVEFSSDNGTPLSVKTDGDSCFVSPGFEHAGTLVSNVTSDSDDLFSEGTLTILSGRHITESDKGKILIHKELADKNDLHLGDTIQMHFSQVITRDMESMGYDTSHMDTHMIQGEIIGIFGSRDNEQNTGLHLSHQLYENYCYIDLETYSSVFNPKSQRFFCQAAFSVASSSDLAVVTNEIKNLEWPAGQPAGIASDLDSFAGMIGSLASLSNLLKIILMVIIVVCITLLYFLLSHGVKQRKREIGIMMSFGLSKSHILMQHIAEVLIAAVIAMVIALPISGGIVHGTGEHIVSAAVDQNDGSELLATEETHERPRKTQIENKGASVSPDAAEIMLLFGFLLIPVSVMTAEFSVLRKEPKENLKSIS